MSDGHRAGSGNRLRLARQARGFSQQQVANMAGVSRQTVSAVESGNSDPSLRVAFALASALGMTIEALFGADDSAAPVTATSGGAAGAPGSQGDARAHRRRICRVSTREVQGLLSSCLCSGLPCSAWGGGSVRVLPLVRESRTRCAPPRWRLCSSAWPSSRSGLPDGLSIRSSPWASPRGLPGKAVRHGEGMTATVSPAFRGGTGRTRIQDCLRSAIQVNGWMAPAGVMCSSRSWLINSHLVPIWRASCAGL